MILLSSIAVYLLFSVGLGIYASQRVRSSQDFMVAGRSLSLPMASTALFATWYGSETILGASSVFIKEGLFGVIEEPFGCVLAFLLIGFLFAKPLYRLNVLTFGDLFAQRFGKKIELLSSLLMILSFLSWIASQLVALGITFHALAGIDLNVAVIGGTISVVLYTVTGGMWAVAITDFLQSIVIIIGLVALLIFFHFQLDSPAQVFESQPKDFFKFLPEPTWKESLAYVAAWLTLGFGSIPSQDVLQRVLSSKSARVAQQSAFVAAIMYLLLGGVPLVIALYAKTLYPQYLIGDEQSFLPNVVLGQAPIWLQIIFFGALLSAILSTASGVILAPASIFAENIIKPMIRRPLSDKQFLFVLRACVLIVASVALLIALLVRNIYELSSVAASFTLVTTFVPVIAAIWIKKAGSLSAALAMVSGLIVWLLAKYVLKTEIPPVLLGLGASVLGLLIGLKRK